MPTFSVSLVSNARHFFMYSYFFFLIIVIFQFVVLGRNTIARMYVNTIFQFSVLFFCHISFSCNQLKGTTNPILWALSFNKGIGNYKVFTLIDFTILGYPSLTIAYEMKERNKL